MKFNKWTTGLAAVGVISLASAARADEKMSQLQTALSNTTISGYVDTAAQWSPGTDSGPFGANIPAYSFARNDGFRLNAIDIALDKPEDAGSWASGYHIELMAGPDAAPVATGGGLNVRQAYVVLRTPAGANGIDWKVGVFDTIIGYEGTTDGSNPNYTRSYGYSIEPTTHTGILGTYKVSDALTISAGVADSSNVGLPGTPAAINGVSPYETQKTYMGTIALTAPDSWGWAKGASLTLGAINALDAHVIGFSSPTTSLYAGLSLPTPIAALKFGAAVDYLEVHNSTPVAFAPNPSDDSVAVYGIYSTYQATDKLSLNLRGEYLVNYGAGPYHTAANPGGSNAEELTATVQYSLWTNVLSRVEFRWDHAEQGNTFGYNQLTGAPTKDNDFLLALNLIYQF